MPNLRGHNHKHNTNKSAPLTTTASKRGHNPSKHKHKHKQQNSNSHQAQNQTQEVPLQSWAQTPSDLGLASFTFLSTWANKTLNPPMLATNLYQLVFGKHQAGMNWVTEGLTSNPNLNLTTISSDNCSNPIIQAVIRCPYGSHLIGHKMRVLSYDTLQLFSCDQDPFAPNTETVKSAIDSKCTSLDNAYSEMDRIAVIFAIALASASGAVLLGIFVKASCDARKARAEAQEANNISQAAAQVSASNAASNAPHPGQAASSRGIYHFGKMLTNSLSSVFCSRNNDAHRATEASMEIGSSPYVRFEL